MENNNITLLPLEDFKEVKNDTIIANTGEERYSSTPTLDLTTPRYYEKKTDEAPSTEKKLPEKDERHWKEKLSAAISREREVFEINREYNREAMKKWSEEKKSTAKEFIDKAKDTIIAAPNKAKDSIITLPERIAKAFRGIPDKIAEIKKDKGFARSAIVTVLLGIWALIVLFPFYYMIITSLKSYNGFNSENDIFSKLVAKAPTFESYAFAFNAVPLAKYFLNTLIFTLGTTAIMLIVTVLASYGFARINFKGKNIVFTAFLSMMMIPAELVVITNFITITNMDLRNTFTGLILPSITSVFYIYLLKENFQQVPNELYYAAKVDGTTDLKYLFKVMAPICQPTIVTVTILKIIECWNSYVWPRLITDDEQYYLVSNGIQAIRENGFGRANIPAMMSAVVTVSVPLILLFLIFRNKIMEGVARGGTKG